MDAATAALELAYEKAALIKADRDLAEGRARIARQSELLDELRTTGQSVAVAVQLLATLEQTLALWEDHRCEIVKRIAYLERYCPDPGLDPSPP